VTTTAPCPPATAAYPSQAADYGADTLMAMAGTMAERAEQALAHAGRDTALPWLMLHLARAVVAGTYAQLATAAAVREHTETLTAAQPWHPPADAPLGPARPWS
jgi:hypothetical protein